jgi:hypothetical protein
MKRQAQKDLKGKTDTEKVRENDNSQRGKLEF